MVGPNNSPKAYDRSPEKDLSLLTKGDALQILKEADTSYDKFDAITRDPGITNLEASELKELRVSLEKSLLEIDKALDSKLTDRIRSELVSKSLLLGDAKNSVINALSFHTAVEKTKTGIGLETSELLAEIEESENAENASLSKVPKGQPANTESFDDKKLLPDVVAFLSGLEADINDRNLGHINQTTGGLA